MVGSGDQWIESHFGHVQGTITVIVKITHYNGPAIYVQRSTTKQHQLRSQLNMLFYFLAIYRVNEMAWPWMVMSLGGHNQF